jgi:hypothetical protein
MRSAFGGPPAAANTRSSSSASRSAVMERSIRCSSGVRVCSPIIDAILIALLLSIHLPFLAYYILHRCIRH